MQAALKNSQLVSIDYKVMKWGLIQKNDTYMSVCMDQLASDTGNKNTFGCFMPQKLDFSLKF